jgi:Ca2+-binding RTX toxin-like protein
MDSARRSLRLGAGMATIFVLALVSTPAASADQASCVYTAATHTATITLTPGQRIATTVSASPTGQIFAGSFGDGGNVVPCGGALITNTDTIVANNSSPSQPLNSFFYIGQLISDGPRSPGFTNEPGSSDEIEFQINFGPGGSIGIKNLPDEVVDIALGGNQINLNRFESDGVDPDVTITGPVLRTLIYRSTGDDHITAAGGPGTPNQSFDFPIESPGGVDFNAFGNDTVIGSDHADILVGTNGNDFLAGGGGKDAISGDIGADTLLGGGGRDRVVGGDGADLIFGNGAKDKLLGGTEKDTILGGHGNDTLLGNQGVDVLNGQAGSKDRCKGPPDQLKNCEIVF